MSLVSFVGNKILPGDGTIRISVLPPSTSVLSSLAFQYPLKLIAPSSVYVSNSSSIAAVEDTTQCPPVPLIVHTVFILTYGGGLVAGDAINLDVHLEAQTRLILLTQGSTKIFRTPTINKVSSQCVRVRLGRGSSLCYLPDPVQPFADSAYRQKQLFVLEAEDTNICFCDWVTAGRPACDEYWSFRMYGSKTEIWLHPTGAQSSHKRLLLRDNLVLDPTVQGQEALQRRMHGNGIFGTLIIGGSAFRALQEYLLEEFRSMPRIGNRQWDENESGEMKSAESNARISQETRDNFLWSIAHVRGFVVIRFSARETEGAKRWLRHILAQDGSVEAIFGERALLCLR